MTDRWERRLRDLRVAAPPGLWDRVQEGPKGPPSNPPRRGQRLVAATVAILVFAAAAAFGLRAFHGGTPVGGPATSRQGPGPTTHTISTSAIVSGGRHRSFRCTATLPKVLTPGKGTGVVFTITNPTNEPETIWIGVNGDSGWLLFERNGTQLQDSLSAHAGIHGPAPSREHLAAGASATIGADDTAVLWPGPMQVIPVCMNTRLPAVTVAVAAPGAPATATDAIDQAIGAFGSRFDHCTPKQSAVWVTGPVPGKYGSVQARCAALVVEHPGFDVVVLAIVSPPDAQAVDLTRLPGEIEAVPSILPPRGAPVALSWWVMVTTVKGVTCSRSMSITITSSFSGYGPAGCPNAPSS
jgi:hypothetical protein